MKYLLFFLLALLSAEPARAYSLLVLDRATFETYKYERYTDPYYPYGQPYGDGEVWTFGAGVNLDYSLIDTGNFAVYHRNWFHMGSTNRQVREAGWQWDLGMRFYNKVELFYGHHSRHLLDARPDPYAAYPLYDVFGVRVIYFERFRR